MNIQNETELKSADASSAMKEYSAINNRSAVKERCAGVRRIRNYVVDPELKRVTCCFTGHRPSKLPWKHREMDSRCAFTKEWIAGQLESLYSRGYRRFLSGMALGCDLYFAEEVIALRQKHRDVELIAAVPCADQTKKWDEKDRLRYVEILNQCNGAVQITETYTRDCMFRRNRYMVENSSFLLACFDGSPGGTMNTVLLADREGIEMRILDVSGLVRDPAKELPPELKVPEMTGAAVKEIIQRKREETAKKDPVKQKT